MLRGRREVALERLVLEVVVEQVGRAAGQHPHGVVDRLPVHAAQVLEHPGDVGLVLRVGAEDVGRRVVEQRPHRLDDPVEVVVVALVGVGVVLRVPPDHLHVLLFVVAEQQVVAVAGRVEVARHHQRHEPVLDEVELVDDLRPQQAQRVGERGEREPGPQLLGDGRAADERALLEHQVRRPDLARYAALVRPLWPPPTTMASYDVRGAASGMAVRCRGGHGLVHGLAVFRAGLKKGSGAVVTATMCVLWCSVVSMCSSVPAAARSGRTRARPTCRWSTGE